jgi:hypothetical protein
MEGREGGKQRQRRNDRDAYGINSIGRMEEKGDLGRKIVPTNLSQSRVVYCAERNYYYLLFPRARGTTYQNFGLQVNRQHYVLVGVDELNSGMIQDVISQISRQPGSTGRSSSRLSLEKSLHIAKHNEAVVRAWD